MIDFRDHLEMLVNLKLQGSNTIEQVSEDLDSNIVNIRLLDGFYPQVFALALCWNALVWINSCAGVVQDKDNIHCGDEGRFDDLPNGDVLILTEGRGVTGFLQPRGFPSATTPKV